MRTTVAALIALLLAMPAQAQSGAAKKAEPVPSARELDDARDMLSLFVSALNSNEVPEATKAGLLMCLNDNPLGVIAKDSAKVFAANKTADPKSASQRLFVVASLCHAPLPGVKTSK